jgi:hypothetical protein
VWLWAAFSTVLLFLLEFILFASFIPSDWSRSIAETEAGWLVAAHGPESAKAIQARADGWYQTLFVETGIAPWTYRLVATGPGVESGQGLEPIGASPAWTWLKGRLDVIWGAFAQALQRAVMLFSWWPFLAILLMAAVVDGWLRRRIRQYGFIYASPLVHHAAISMLLVLWVGAGLLLFAPIPIPALAVPILCGFSALLVDIGLTNAQKRL